MQEFGDGIMSAIDMFATVDDVEGKLGEKRLVLTLNGKVSSPEPVARIILSAVLPAPRRQFIKHLAAPCIVQCSLERLCSMLSDCSGGSLL